MQSIFKDFADEKTDKILKNACKIPKRNLFGSSKVRLFLFFEKFLAIFFFRLLFSITLDFFKKLLCELFLKYL